MASFTRRAFLSLALRAGAAAALGAALGCRRGMQPLPVVTIQGAPSPPSLALLRVAQRGVPRELAGDARFQVWSTVDEMRARITSGQAHFSGLPVNVAATLYNRGVEVQLLNVYIWGILYLVSPEPSINSLADLRGETVLIPFRGDLPDILTQYLLQRAGLNLAEDLKPSYLSAAPEAAQLLAAGRARYAVLSEPSATLAIQKAQQNGITLYRSLDYAQAWAAATRRRARIPMAGVAAHPDVARTRPELLDWFQSAHRDAVPWVAAHADEATQAGAEAIHAIPPAVMRDSLTHIQSTFEEAGTVRAEIEFFLSEMHALSPELIGGRLPPDGFYG
ncbi:MAG TPA: hypothetical protein PLJ35_16960 [Anaerolineae bacterium]|nr:hypothetical protein [Anaerolineae bacterium]HOR00503.1 hypothetical protein [Anaerolineae bacterium]HPL28220.1 hypothetical protein [Anaerolineae bacterium]HPL28223.1 hypothetical protein [Anaerolineae bacterium]